MKLISTYNLMLLPKAAARRKWGDWEIVREFVQNALDATGTASIELEGNDLVITDKGKGFDATSFLIGETEKNPKCDRGMFGDGMKFACLAAINLGYSVEIHTKSFIFRPVLKEAEFPTEKGKIKKVKTLWIEQYESEYIPGTEVRIHGYKGPTFRERFIFHDEEDHYNPVFYIKVDRSDICSRKAIFYNEIMLPPGTLFVKDIYVSALKDGIFSYNLIDVELGVDRNIASEFSVDSEISQLWQQCDDVNLITELLEELYDKPASYEANMHWDFRLEYKEVMKDPWTEALKRYAGSDEKGNPAVFHARTDEEAKLAEYYSRGKYTPLSPKALARELKYVGLIPSASDIITQYRKAAIRILSDDEVSELELTHLNIARAITSALIEEPFDVIAITSDVPDILGTYDKENRRITITKRALNTLLSTMEVLSHELVHHKIGADVESNTTRFVKEQNAILLKIMNLIGSGKIKIPHNVVWTK